MDPISIIRLHGIQRYAEDQPDRCQTGHKITAAVTDQRSGHSLCGQRAANHTDIDKRLQPDKCRHTESNDPSLASPGFVCDNETEQGQQQIEEHDHDHEHSDDASSESNVIENTTNTAE